MNQSSSDKKWCVISAVGEKSLHREWISGEYKFDLHLIIYDESFDKFKGDTPYIEKAEGYKLKLIYNYFKTHNKFIEKYDYFYMPDDDISIDTENIHRLFKYMAKFNLAVAQPAISNSYYSHQHTRKQEDSLLRYTNFVEMMQPCFSREALKKTLFTFNENEHGWGADFHWGEIVNYEKRNMAIIDDVNSIHTRPTQSSHHEELNRYLKKYNLEKVIYVTE